MPFVVFTKHTVLYNALYPVTHHPSIASPDNKYHVLKVGAMLRDLAAFANPTLLYINLQYGIQELCRFGLFSIL